MDDIIGQRPYAQIDAGRRCSATSKSTGERCARAPIPGGFVCAMHGGGAEHVRRAARERLLALVDPALDALVRALGSGPPCPACGRADADRHPAVIRAAQLVLDRCGFAPKVSLELSRPGEDLGHLTDDELIARLEEVLAQARAARDAGRDRAVSSRGFTGGGGDRHRHRRTGTVTANGGRTLRQSELAPGCDTGSTRPESGATDTRTMQSPPRRTGPAKRPHRPVPGGGASRKRSGADWKDPAGSERTTQRSFRSQ